MDAAAVTDLGALARLRVQARAEDPAALRKAAEQFEGLMLQQMLKAMRAASLGDDLLGGQQVEAYQDMFDQQIAQQLSATKGLGLADALVLQMQRGRASGAVEASSSFDPLKAVLPERRQDLGVPGPLSAARAAQPLTPTHRAAPVINDAPAEGFVQGFIDRIRPHAERAARALGVPAQVLMAQAALETGWGRHGIQDAEGRAANNLFGIKADARWSGPRATADTAEYGEGGWRRERAAFRAYPDVGAAFDDYVAFLRGNPRYREALAHGGDARQFVSGLQQAGYATDPRYAEKILQIADSPRLRAATAPAEVL
jgi:peptidoglycan hydrolase FlgJ